MLLLQSQAGCMPFKRQHPCPASWVMAFCRLASGIPTR